MTELTWDQVGEHLYETGADHGVLYLPDGGGAYDTGFAWNGLTNVTESPTGGDYSPQYADNIKYLNLQSIEEFGCTIEAFTYPDEFMQCDGTAELEPGVLIGQQTRKPFGFSYRTLIGNDTEGTDLGYKIHLVYGCTATPSDRAHATVNDSPEAVQFSWDVTTTPVQVTGFKPTASLVVDSTKVDPTDLAELEAFLYGTSGTDPSMPLPLAVKAIFAGALIEAVPTEPAYNTGTGVITIPVVTGVVYKINGVVVSGAQPAITVDTIVNASPAAGYKFPAVTDDDWLFEAP